MASSASCKGILWALVAERELLRGGNDLHVGTTPLPQKSELCTHTCKKPFMWSSHTLATVHFHTDDDAGSLPTRCQAGPLSVSIGSVDHSTRLVSLGTTPSSAQAFLLMVPCESKCWVGFVQGKCLTAVLIGQNLWKKDFQQQSFSSEPRMGVIQVSTSFLFSEVEKLQNS